VAALRAPVIGGQAWWLTEFGGRITPLGQVSCGKAAWSEGKLFCWAVALVRRRCTCDLHVTVTGHRGETAHDRDYLSRPQRREI